ncbi:MAG TPA: C45 family peptidase [Acidimicrobiales bacterium]|nr:C45 family peptidase [Acidimicrobiales bacterium]
MEQRYPSIRVGGGPRQRGRAYGEAARDRVRISREAYEEAFGRTAGWTWAQARDAAAAYLAPVEAAFPQYLEEMRGIAEGAGLPFEDVLTLNTRTEVMYAAKARQAASLGRGECTSFALLGERTASGRLLAGQNWDWLAHCTETVVVLEVEQPGAVNFVTVVEAGLLAKASLNAAGLAVATNALVTSADRGAPGLPYHVILRGLADCETPADGVDVVLGHVRSSSANYLLASADGLVLDLEAAPGDYRAVSVLEPEGGALVHTNHFLRPPAGQDDVSVWAMSDTHLRRQRALPALADPGRRHDPESIRDVLADHAGYPFGVCSHADPRVGDGPAWATITAVVMDPAERRLWLTSGRPCETPLLEVELGGLLHEPTPLAKHRPAG